jgi:hypothetical protein
MKNQQDDKKSVYDFEYRKSEEQNIADRINSLEKQYNAKTVLKYYFNQQTLN